ncbi:MAG: efflux RND transporter periplasmic adaptor subunit [Bacillota bacterium]
MNVLLFRPSLLRRGIIFWLILWLTVSFTGCTKNQQAPAAQQGAGAGRPPAAVAVQSAKKGKIVKEYMAGGQVAGIRTVTVAPKISGRAASVPVAAGQAVREGDVLFTLDSTDAENQVRQARASLAVAQENKKLADVNRANAKKQLERYRQLYEAGAVPADTYEQYALKYEQAAAPVPEAQLAQAEAALATQETNLANHTVRAPFGGVVAKVSVDPGEMVSPTSQCVTLVDLSRVKVEVAVGEQEVNKIRPGQVCRVTVAAARSEPFPGTVTAVSPAADDKTKGFTVEVTLDNPAGILKQGMYAEVHLVTDTAEEVLTVPVEAVLNKDGRRVVFVVEGGEAKERTVIVGLTDGRLAEIKEGLKEGEQIVVTGNQSLTNGSKVIVSGAQGGGASAGGTGPQGAPGTPGAQGGNPGGARGGGTAPPGGTAPRSN